MERGLKDEDSAQSLEGTLLHQYDANPSLERAVLKPNQQDLLRISSELDEFIFARVAEQFGVAPDEACEEGREKELMALRGDENETPGNCDRFRYYPVLKLLVIVDKKMGYKEVAPAAANYQLRTYAIGGAEEWDAENIVVAITQPRLPYEQRVTMASYGREDIEASRAELASIRATSRRPDAPLVAGEEQCRYCRAKAKCPAFTSQLVPLDQGKELVTTLGQLTVTQRDSLIRACKFSDYIKDPLYDHEREVIAAGGESLYTLGKTQEMRKVIDPKRAVALFALRGDLTRDEVLACSKPSLTKIEETLREKKKCTWKEAKEIVEDTIGSVIERDQKKQSLLRKKE
jgi:hypothetical protein